MKRKFYITTPIYYVNAKPHIGSAYPTIMADVLARYHRLLGDDVFYLTGTDENSQKNVQAAEAAGERDIVTYLDRMSAAWQMTWKTLMISNDHFIRTTDALHAKGVEVFFKKVQEAGDIYKGMYEGLYCVGCEAFITEKELVDGKCPDHQKEPLTLKEENYFFRASRYKDALLEHINAHPEFVEPASRRNEVVAYIKDHFHDISISRGWKTSQNIAGVTVGIPVPGDENQALYVWFDALINYLTGIGYGTDQKQFKNLWPADVHVVGKEIIKFHCALWPAMLMSAGLPLPITVFAHGWLTVEGQKMSKSLGNIIDPLEIVGRYGNDVLRYFLLREFTWGGDGDFSEGRIRERYQSDLANGLGNVSRRILTLGEKMLAHNKLINNATHECGERCGILKSATQNHWRQYQEAMDAVRPDLAAAEVWKYIEAMDQSIEQTKPWELKQEDSDETWSLMMYPLLECLRHLAWMLRPLLPETAEQLFRSLGIWTKEQERSLEEAKGWGMLSTKGLNIERGKVLFPRL